MPSGTTRWKCVLHNHDAFPCLASRVLVGFEGGGGLIHYLWSAPRLLQNSRNASPFVRLGMAIFGRSSEGFWVPSVHADFAACWKNGLTAPKYAPRRILVAQRSYIKRGCLPDTEDGISSLNRPPMSLCTSAGSSLWRRFKKLNGIRECFSILACWRFDFVSTFFLFSSGLVIVALACA